MTDMVLIDVGRVKPRSRLTRPLVAGMTTRLAWRNLAHDRVRLASPWSAWRSRSS